MGLQRECQTERRRIPVEKPVAKIDGNTLPSQLATILKTGDAIDIVRRESASDLDPEIIGGHQLQFEFLVDRPLVTAHPGKTSGGLPLEFTFARPAPIRTHHVAKSVFS